MPQIKILVIPADDAKPIRIETLPEGEGSSLKHMQTTVDGYIEDLPTPPGYKLNLFANELGKLQDFPPNRRATLYYGRIWDSPEIDILVGNVILAGETDEKGDLTDLPDNVIDQVPS